MTINQRLKQLREQSGLTLEEVSKKVGVSKQTVQKYESGVVLSIPSDKIESLAEVYEVSPGYIMGWDNDMLTPPHTEQAEDTMALREQLRRQPGMRLLFNAAKGATEQDLKDAAALIEGFKRRRDGED